MIVLKTYICLELFFIVNTKQSKMKNAKLIFYITTGLFSALMLMSAGMYLFNTAEVSQTFASLGYPSFIIYPLAIAKILGVIAIWTGRSNTLKEWAYAGFFFDTLLAFQAHIMAGDGQAAPAAVVAVLVLVSYWADKQRAVAA